MYIFGVNISVSKYYIVFNEWNYPTESGREYIGDYNTREEAANIASFNQSAEIDNFIAVNNNLYREACGAYYNENNEIEGYMLHSSQHKE